jgi:TetR/AcrR family transcriptional regulator, copper-responsive repressor
VDHYLTRPGCYVQQILQEAPTAREAVESMLRTATIQQTRRGKPHGCLLMSAVTHSPSATEVKTALIKLRHGVERRVKERIERGISDGELPRHMDAAALASFYLAIVQGMSTQARDGATRDKLCAIADAAMSIWPLA